MARRWRRDCCPVRRHTPGKATDEAFGRRRHPRIKVIGVAAPDQTVKPVDEIARLHQSRSCLLDDGGNRAIGAGQQLRAGRKRSGEGTCAGTSARSCGHLVAASPGRPFADDAQRAREPMAPQPPPEFSPVAAAGRPLGIEPIEPGLERTRARSERLGAAAPNDVAHHLARAAGAADDFPYRDAVLVQRQHRRISLGAATPAVMLKALRRRQDRRIDRALAECGADDAHLTTHRGQEGSARVFKEMPAICDLQSLGTTLRGRRAVAAAAIPGDDLDRRPRRKPCRDRGRLSIRQQIDHAPPLKVTDQRAVAMPLAPRPVVHPDDLRRFPRDHLPAPDGSQKRIFAHRQQQPACHPLPRASAKRPAEMLHQPVQPLSPPGESPGNRRLQTFRKDSDGRIPAPRTGSAAPRR